MIFDKLEKLGFREKVGLGIAAGFVLFLVLDRLVVGPMIGTYRQLHDAIGIRADQLGLNNQAVRMEQDVYRRYRQVADLVHKAESPSLSVDAVKGQIDDLASRAGVVLISWDHRKSVETEHYQEHFIDIRELEAPETNLVAFLRMIPTAPGLLRVERLNLVPDRKRHLVKGSLLISKVMMLTPPGPDAEE